MGYMSASRAGARAEPMPTERPEVHVCDRAGRPVLLRNRASIAILITVLSLAPACAFDLVRVKQEPTLLEVQSARHAPWTLTEKVSVRIGTGYTTKLESGTHWTHVGNIPQGDVYRTTDQIVTVVGPNIFEAQIVVRDRFLVGFYLPVERTYTLASEPRELKMAITEVAE